MFAAFRSTIAPLVPAVLTVAILSGCGSAVEDAPEVFVVKGKLTKAGAPIAGVSIEFIPNSDGVSGTGTSGDDGTFEIVAGHGLKGMPAGSYSVVLNKMVDSAAYDMADGGDPTAVDLPFPQEYTDPTTTPKQVEVKAEENNITIEVE
jgi:hypothetical protein